MFKRIRYIRSMTRARVLLILGDITDAKDNHSAVLVNRICDELNGVGIPVVVLKGNHDYKLDHTPFFSFLSHMDSVRFVDVPSTCGRWMMLPHSRAELQLGPDLIRGGYTHCFMHQTVSGAVSENGQCMESTFDGVGDRLGTAVKFYSGDIHVPQRIGNVEYVGSPYPVHFGDTFTPRILVLKGPRANDVTQYEYEGIKRAAATIATASELDALGLTLDDQLKVRLSISSGDMHEWHEHKSKVQEYCDRRGIRLVSIELVRAKGRVQLRGDAVMTSAKPTDVLSRYVESRGIEKAIADCGLDIVRKGDGGADRTG